MKKTFIILCLSCLSFALSAQDGITLHFMRLNPYSTYSNPSAFTQYTGYVGIPGISNINVALTNTGIHYKTLFGTNNDGTITTIKLNNFADKLNKKGNYLNSNIALNIINFGFKVHKLRFDFSYRIRVDEYFSYNRDLIALPVHGNIYYANQNKQATPELKLNLNCYQEFALGIQAEITPQVYIGVKPKLLFGLAHAKTKNASASIFTDPENYSIALDYNLDANISCVMPYTITSDTNNKLGFQFYPDQFAKHWQDAFKNVGAAIDLGVTYRINDQFGIAASVLDLGFIHWKTNNYKISGHSSDANDGSFVFDGLSSEDIELLKENPEEFKNVLLSHFPMQIQETKAFTSALAGRFILEGYCNVGKYHRFTALFQGRIVNSQFMPSFTVAWNGTFLNIFDLCVSYSIAKKSYTNLGVGVGFNLGVFHLYAATDNLIAICTNKNPLQSLMNASNANIQMGIVFDWGKLQEEQLAKIKYEKSSKRVRYEE